MASSTSRARLWTPVVITLVLVNGILLLWAPWTVTARGHQADLAGSAAEAALARTKVNANDLTGAERRVERIGWYFDWDEAHAAAKKLGRPIFLLTMDGELDGRC